MSKLYVGSVVLLLIAPFTPSLFTDYLALLIPPFPYPCLVCDPSSFTLFEPSCCLRLGFDNIEI
jgi:hypothetical protein